MAAARAVDPWAPGKPKAKVEEAQAGARWLRHLDAWDLVNIRSRRGRASESLPIDYF